jgi:uncharacterized lipoprotein YehR (DUF1307 family)
MMLLKTLVKAVVVMGCLVMIAGCKPENKPEASAPAAQEQVKTEAEYKAEAQKEVTEENMAQELDSLEKAVEAEDAGTP